MNWVYIIEIIKKQAKKLIRKNQKVAIVMDSYSYYGLSQVITCSALGTLCHLRLADIYFYFEDKKLIRRSNFFGSDFMQIAEFFHARLLSKVDTYEIKTSDSCASAEEIYSKGGSYGRSRNNR